MPERARVTSLEAVEAFRAKLIIYRERAGRLLDEVNDDVIRARLWLQNDCTTHWQDQIRRRTHDLEQRQQELFSAQLSGLRDASYAQQAAVQKAKRAIRDAEERLQLVKQWKRQFDHRVEPLARNVEKFRHNLGHDLGAAVTWLAEAAKTLSAYAELSSGGSSTAMPAVAPDDSSNLTEGKSQS